LFDVVSQLGHWVGRARIGTFEVTIEGSRFALPGLDLIRITTSAHYILGTRRFEGEGEGLVAVFPHDWISPSAECDIAPAARV
jgi:hypothetical protein